MLLTFFYHFYHFYHAYRSYHANLFLLSLGIPLRLCAFASLRLKNPCGLPRPT